MERSAGMGRCKHARLPGPSGMVGGGQPASTVTLNKHSQQPLAQQILKEVSRRILDREL